MQSKKKRNLLNEPENNTFTRALNMCISYEMEIAHSSQCARRRYINTMGSIQKITHDENTTTATHSALHVFFPSCLVDIRNLVDVESG